MKNYFLTIVYLLFASLLFAQPANDECANAINLVVDTNGNCTNTLGTNNLATDSGIAHLCGSYNGGDVWYSLVVPAGGEVTIETNTAGGFTDSGIQAYSGPCGSLVNIECDDDDGTGAFSLLNLTGLTPGEVIFIAVWEFDNDNNGLFNICAYAPPPPPDPIPGKDCLAATALCCGEPIPAPTPGFGAIDELIPNDCVGDTFDEDNTSWAAISVTSAGSISMNFDAMPDIDIDFAAWLIPSPDGTPVTLEVGCASLANDGTGGVIDRCDWTASSTESGFGPACGGGTGCDTEGSIPVNPGDLLIVVVDDFNAFDDITFSADVLFEGGAEASCPPPVVDVIDSTCDNECGPNTGTLIPGTIMISNCPTVATITEYSQDGGLTWTTGTPPYSTTAYTGNGGANPLIIRCNDIGNTCPSQNAPVITNPIICENCIPECPIGVSVEGPTPIICDGESIMSEITDWQTDINTANPLDAVQDEDNVGTIVYSSVTPMIGTLPDNNFPNGDYSGDGCTPILQSISAYILCDLDQIANNGDETYEFISEFVVNIYPDISNNLISTTNDVCGPVVTSFDCMGTPGFSIINSLDANGATPDYSSLSSAGTVTFTVTNSNYSGSNTDCQTFSVTTNYFCLECPTVNTLNPFSSDICESDGIGTSVSDWQSIINTFNPLDSNQDPDNVGSIVYSDTTPSVANPHNGNVPDGSYGEDGCAIDSESTSAYILCDFDGITNSGDETYQLIGTFDLNIFPDISSNTIVTSNTDCGPIVTSFDCMSEAGYVISNSIDGNGAIPDYSSISGAGSITFTITNSNYNGTTSNCQSFSTVTNYNCSSCPTANSLNNETIDICQTEGLGANLSNWQAAINTLNPLDAIQDPSGTGSIVYSSITPTVATPHDGILPNGIYSEDGCISENQSTSAYLLCDLDGIPQNGDELYQIISTFSLNIFPDISSNTISISNDDCGPIVTSYDCEGIPGYTISNDLDSNGANPNYSSVSENGTITFTVTNNNYNGLQNDCQSFSITANYTCQTCPNVILVPGPSLVLCETDGIGTILSDWQTNVSNANPLDAIQDPSGIASIVYSSVTPNSSTAPNGFLPDASYSGNGCSQEFEFTAAYIQCDFDGVPNNGDESYQIIGAIVLSLVPDVSNFSITISDDECGPIVTSFQCQGTPGYVVTNNIDGNGANPVYDLINNSGTVTFTVSNNNYIGSSIDCQSFNISAPYNCSTCPEVSVVEDSNESICEAEGLGNLITAWQTDVTSANPLNPDQDPSGTGTIVYSSITPVIGTLPDNSFPNSNYNGDGCNIEQQTVSAYILCDLDGIDESGDEQYFLISTLTLNVFPEISNNTITLSNDECGPIVTSYDCQGVTGYSITNSIDGNGSNPDYSSFTNTGSVTFTVTNNDYTGVNTICQSYEITTNYTCFVCPLVNVVQDANLSICAFDGIGTSLSEWQNTVITSNPLDSTQDPSGTGSIVYSSVTPTSTIPPDGIVPDGTYDGDSCNNDLESTNAYILCDLDGIPNNGDESYLLISSFNLSIFPDISTYNIEVSTDECGPVITNFDCMAEAGFLVSNNLDSNGAIPDYSTLSNAGTITFTISNTNYIGSSNNCQSYSNSYAYNCSMCPSALAVVDPLIVLCSSEDIGSELSDWMASVNTTNPLDVSQDPSGLGEIVYSSTTPDLLTPPDNFFPSGIYSEDGCISDIQVTSAYIFCDLDGIPDNGDESYQFIGSFTLTIFPDISDGIIAVTSDVCGPSVISFPCEGVAGYTISNDFDVNGGTPNYSNLSSAGNITFSLNNINYTGDNSGCQSLSSTFNFDCLECPDVNLVNGPTSTICSADGIGSLLADWQTMITTNNPLDLIQDPSNVGSIVYSSVTPNSVTEPNGFIPDGSYNGNGCDSELQTTSAYIQCDLDGIPNNGDETYELIGTINITIVPDISQFSITITTEECGPTVTNYDCMGSPGYTITNNIDANGASPDYSNLNSASEVIFTVFNTNYVGPNVLCQSFSSSSMYDCQECPTPVLVPNENIDICSSTALGMDFTEWQNTITNSNPLDGVQDPSNIGSIVYSSITPNSTTSPDGLVPDGIYNGDGCNSVTQQTSAFLQCDPDGILGNSDDSYELIGTFSLNIFPDISNNIIVINTEACGPTALSFDCEGVSGYTISNSLDDNGASPDYSNLFNAGNVTFTITNSNYLGTSTDCQSFDISSSYTCYTCPSAVTVNDPNIEICDTEGLSTILSEWQSSVNTSNPLDINQDPSGTGTIVYSSILPTISTPPNGIVPNATYSGDGCNSDTETTSAYLLCDLDGIANNGDEVYELIGSFTITMFPDISTNLITLDMDDCGPIVTGYDCMGNTGFIVQNSLDGNGANPDYSSITSNGFITFTITNTNYSGSISECQSYSTMVPYNCELICPTPFIIENESEIICSSQGIGSVFTDWQTAINTANPLDANQDPSDIGSIVYSSIAPSTSINPDNFIPTGVYSGNGCETFSESTSAYILCDFDGILNNGDETYTFISSFNLSIYPDISNNNIVLNSDLCGPSVLSYDCQGNAGYVITNNIDSNGATPDYSSINNSGTVTFTITNSNYPGSTSSCMSFSTSANYNCGSCPSPQIVLDPLSSICESEGLGSTLSDWQSTVIASNPLDAVQDPSGVGTIVYSSVTPNTGTLPDGILPNGVYTGTGCDSEIQTTSAYILCDIDGLNNSGDETYLLIGSFSLNIYPDVLDPNEMIEDCTNTITTLCTDVIGSGSNPTGGASVANWDETTGIYTSLPGEEQGTLDISISSGLSGSNCSAVFTITTPECPDIEYSVDLAASDPCDCNGDQSANGAGDGTFSETVTIITNPLTAGLNLCVANGATGIPAGSSFTDNNDGSYAIEFNHIDAQGFSLQVADCSDLNTPLIPDVLSNICYYPIVELALPSTICEDDNAFNLNSIFSEISGNGDFMGNVTFSGSYLPGGAVFNPTANGIGSYTIIATYEPTVVVGTNTGTNANCPTSVMMNINVLECDCDSDNGTIGIKAVPGN